MSENLPSDLVARARRCADTFRALSRVSGLLRGLLPGDDDLYKLEDLRTDLEARLNHLTTYDRQPRKFEDVLEKCENHVLRLSRGLGDVDAEIPMEWFRAHFDGAIATSEAVADYAALVGKSAGEDPARLDRVQFLLTRVVTQHLNGQKPEWARLKAVLEEFFEPVQLDAAQRKSALQFFSSASARVATFGSISELITSGFFVDTRGYKLSLRRTILDPELMAGVIELNEATTATINKLKWADAPGDRQLNEHLAEVDERLLGVFKALRANEAERTVRFEKRLARNARAAAKQKRPGSKGPSKALRVFVQLRPWLLATGIAIGGVVLYGQSRPSGFSELSSDDATAFSPLLVRAGVSPRAAVLVGEVDKARWALLSLEQRREAAAALSDALGVKGLGSATVMLENRVVIQIEQGQVLIAQ